MLPDGSGSLKIDKEVPYETHRSNLSHLLRQVAHLRVVIPLLLAFPFSCGVPFMIVVREGDAEHRLKITSVQAYALAKLIRIQLVAFNEADSGESESPAEALTGADLDILEPLMALLIK